MNLVVQIVGKCKRTSCWEELLFMKGKSIL